MLAIPKILFGIVGFIKGPKIRLPWTSSIQLKVSISKFNYVSGEKEIRYFYDSVGDYIPLFVREYEIKPYIPFFFNQDFMLHGIFQTFCWFAHVIDPLSSPWPGANSCGL